MNPYKGEIMSRLAEIAINLLIAVVTVVFLSVLTWTVRKLKSRFKRNNSPIIEPTDPLTSEFMRESPQPGLSLF